MSVSRRLARPLTLACATAALAVAPGTADAMPATDPPPSRPSSSFQPRAIETVAAVREVRTDGDTTLALIFSGTALLIAGGAAAISARDHRRIGQINHPMS